MEVAHHHYRATLAAAGVKKHRLPEPLHIPRPSPDAHDVDEAPGIPRQRPDGRRHATTVSEVVAVLARGFGPRR